MTIRYAAITHSMSSHDVYQINTLTFVRPSSQNKIDHHHHNHRASSCIFRYTDINNYNYKYKYKYNINGELTPLPRSAHALPSHEPSLTTAAAAAAAAAIIQTIPRYYFFTDA